MGYHSVLLATLGNSSPHHFYQAMVHPVLVGGGLLFFPAVSAGWSPHGRRRENARADSRRGDPAVPGGRTAPFLSPVTCSRFARRLSGYRGIGKGIATQADDRRTQVGFRTVLVEFRLSLDVGDGVLDADYAAESKFVVVCGGVGHRNRGLLETAG